MKVVALKPKHLETLLSALLSMVVMAGLLALLIVTGFLFATENDERIESAVQRSDVFTNYLRGDDIRIDSRGGTVTLMGTVAEESHIALAARAVAGLPGVRSVENRLEVTGGNAPRGPRATRVLPQQRW